jgi:hypothetical protein
MSARHDHGRAPQVARAALREATDLFGRLPAAAIRNGAEHVTPLAPEPPRPRHRVQFLARAESVTTHQTDRLRDICRAPLRDVRGTPDDPLAPKQRPRPAIGCFTILDLGPDTCRFPFGDGPFFFCGATPVPGKPYCAGCIRGVYRGDGDILPE